MAELKGFSPPCRAVNWLLGSLIRAHPDGSVRAHIGHENEDGTGYLMANVGGEGFKIAVEKADLVSDIKCDGCDFLEPRKLRCRATEDLPHVGHYTMHKENKLPNPYPDFCPRLTDAV